MDIQTRYDTSEVSSRDRFAYWQEAVCDSYVNLGCQANNRHGFNGLIEVSRHSTLSISRVSGNAHTVQRRNRDIRKATDSYFLLSLQTAQSSRVSQFGKTALLNQGDMALYSSTNPYELELSDNFSQSVLQLPADRLTTRLPNAEMLTATKIDGQTEIGRLVSQNILAFANHAGSPDPVFQALVQETLIDLIATGLAAQGRSVATLSSPEQHVMLRVKTFIRNNLARPELDRHMVAAEIGMSVRRINAIFAKEDSSLSAYIKQMRLEAVARELIDVRFSNLTISEIAVKYGFENFQNFSRVFRAHFSMSAREYRCGNKLAMQQSPIEILGD